MNMNKINKTTSPFPNIKNDMLDRLSKEADGRIQKAQPADDSSPRETSNFASRKAVWFRVFFRGNETFEARSGQVSRLQA